MPLIAEITQNGFVAIELERKNQRQFRVRELEGTRQDADDFAIIAIDDDVTANARKASRQSGSANNRMPRQRCAGFRPYRRAA